MTLAAQQIDQYVNQDAPSCPHCDSYEIVRGDTRTSLARAYRLTRCASCGESWVEVHHMLLVSIQEIGTEPYHDVCVVSVTKFGSDIGVFLDGELILTADSGAHESVEAVEQVAQSLAALNHVAVRRISHQPGPGWVWDQVSQAIFSQHAEGGYK